MENNKLVQNGFRGFIEKNALQLILLLVGLIIGWTILNARVDAQSVQIEKLTDERDEIIDRLARIETKMDFIITELAKQN